MKKKLFAIFMVLCLVLSTLVACGDKTTDAPSTTDNNKPATTETSGAAAETEAAAPALSEETEELKMIMITVIGSTEEAQLVEDQINAYIEPLIHATVDMEWLDLGEYFSTIIPRLATGEEIDVLPTFGTFLSALTGQEALMDITQLVADYGTGIADAVGADFMEAGQVNGAQYALPIVAAFGQEPALLYRADIVEEMGIDMSTIKTIDDVTELLAKVHEAYPELTLICANSSSEPQLKEWAWDGLGDEYGVLLDPTSDTTVVNLFESEEYKEYVTLMREWYEAGYVQADAATCADSLSTIFETGQYFGTIAKNYPGNMEEKFSMSAYPFDAVAIDAPISTTALATSNVMTIPATAKYPEKAMAFINLLYTDATLQNLLRYGIQDQHYRLVDGRADYMEGEFIMTAKYVSKYNLGDYTLSYEAVTDPVGIHETIKEYNNNTTKSVALGFTYDSTPVANELTAVANVCAKYRRGLEVGSLDPETELPKFIEELKAAGIDTIIQEKQAQLDAWLAQ